MPCTSLNAQHVYHQDPQEILLCFVASFLDIAGNDVATGNLDTGTLVTVEDSV